jgi:AbrB family looped-hinge helix DNA binding protein
MFALLSGNDDGISYSMSETITIDGAGRLVVPKPMREKLSLRGGEKLTVKVVGDHLELVPDEPAPTLEKRGKRTVVTNWGEYDAGEAVREAQARADAARTHSEGQ